MRKKCAALLIFLVINFAAACNRTQNLSVPDTVKTFRYDIMNGKIIPIKSVDGLWITDSFTVSSNTLCIIAYTESKGWKLRDFQQLGIACDIKNNSQESEKGLLVGVITNDGLQNEAVSGSEFSARHFELLFDSNTTVPCYIYFMNTSSTDIVVENLKLWRKPHI